MDTSTAKLKSGIQWIYVNLEIFLLIAADEGKIVEKEVNERGPGEAVYIGCDVTKEDEIKASLTFAKSTLSFINYRHIILQYGAYL